MVAKGHQLMREKHGLPNVKRNWNAAPRNRKFGIDGGIEP